MDFTYSVELFEEFELFGIYEKTSYENVNTDCPKVWEAFFPVLETLFGSNINEVIPTYGVSIMTPEQSSFAYWAAIDLPPTIKLPHMFSPVVIPAGYYVGCLVPSLEYIELAFASIYTKWAPRQREYIIDVEKICFETYTPYYRGQGEFLIYLPVKKAPVNFFC